MVISNIKRVALFLSLVFAMTDQNAHGQLDCQLARQFMNRHSQSDTSPPLSNKPSLVVGFFSMAAKQVEVPEEGIRLKRLFFEQDLPSIGASHLIARTKKNSNPSPNSQAGVDDESQARKLLARSATPNALVIASGLDITILPHFYLVTDTVADHRVRGGQFVGSTQFPSRNISDAISRVFPRGFGQVRKAETAKITVGGSLLPTEQAGKRILLKQNGYAAEFEKLARAYQGEIRKLDSLNVVFVVHRRFGPISVHYVCPSRWLGSCRFDDKGNSAGPLLKSLFNDGYEPQLGSVHQIIDPFSDFPPQDNDVVELTTLELVTPFGQ